MKRAVLLVSFLLVVAPRTGAAPPEVPDQVPYSAVLAGGGAGPVDLTIRIYDAALSGTLLYVEDFSGVALTDGAFSLVLGPTGRVTDSPVDPLSADLVTALVGDLAAAAPDRFIEVTVDTDPPFARERIRVVPFALHAGSAESADTAASADQVVEVGGVPAEAVTQIWENFNFDGGPENTDPREGLADVDGDGVANFLDSDNDGDLIDDSSEISAGTDINLVTPAITSLTPVFVPLASQLTVAVQGSFFEPGISVLFGSQAPTPTNVTSTSFDVLIAPETGEVPVTVTRLNGESATATFPLITPTITGFSPSFVPFATQQTVEVQGTSFEPGISVVFGSQTPTPTNITETSFDVLVGPQSGDVQVTVARLNGEADTASFSFGDGVHSQSPVNGAGLDFDVFGSSLLVGRPGSYSVYDGAFGPPISASNIAVAWTPSGQIAAVRYTGGDLLYVVDANGDGFVDETAVVIQENVLVESASLVFDASGRPVIGYLRTGQGIRVMVARDFSADGDFADPGEVVQLQQFGGTIVRRSEAAIDPAGRAAYLYQTSAGSTLRVAWDRSGDGNFDDKVGGRPEIAVVFGGSGDTDCFGITFDSAGKLVIAYQNPSNSALVLARDGNDDGDVNDAGERTELAANTAVCDVERTVGGGLQVVHGGSGLFRLRDVNDDGDFSDAGESVTLIPAPAVVDAVEIGSDDLTATETNIVVAP